jgi:hypothetical protein
MDHAAERQAVVTAVFAVTGKKVDEDDPIVVAALFQAYTMREATREAVEQIADVGQAVKIAVDDARKAADEASAISRRAAFDEKARADALEARVRKAVLEAGRVHLSQDGPPTGWRGVIAGLVIGVFFAGGVMSVACNFSFSWVSDARLGAEFRKVIPSLEPSLRNKLMKHLEKRRT